jgi:hypothetical protein
MISSDSPFTVQGPPRTFGVSFDHLVGGGRQRKSSSTIASSTNRPDQGVDSARTEDGQQKCRADRTCVQCNNELIAPEWSEYRNERQIRHLWRCEQGPFQLKSDGSSRTWGTAQSTGALTHGIDLWYWPEADMPVSHFRVRSRRFSCRASLGSAMQFMTQSRPRLSNSDHLAKVSCGLRIDAGRVALSDQTVSIANAKLLKNSMHVHFNSAFAQV